MKSCAQSVDWEKLMDCSKLFSGVRLTALGPLLQSLVCSYGKPQLYSIDVGLCLDDRTSQPAKLSDVDEPAAERAVPRFASLGRSLDCVSLSKGIFSLGPRLKFFVRRSLSLLHMVFILILIFNLHTSHKLFTSILSSLTPLFVSLLSLPTLTSDHVAEVLLKAPLACFLLLLRLIQPLHIFFIHAVLGL